MSQYVYDIEVFPNFFSATFINVETQAVVQYTVCDQRDQRADLVRFLHSCSLLIGFNSLSYDDPMLRLFMDNVDQPNLLTAMFEMSKRLISDHSRQDEEVGRLRYGEAFPWKQLDLMKIMAFDRLGVNLKQVAINLRWHTIQDLPLPYDHLVQADEIDTILRYNLNDVLITLELYTKIQPQIRLREEISRLYMADVTNASDSKIANVVLEKIYTEVTRKNSREIRDLRTQRESVDLKDCIAPDIEFRTRPLQTLLSYLRTLTVHRDSSFGYSYMLEFDGTQYELGIGGLHSKDGPGTFLSTSTCTIRDADVSSYYPSIMINNGIKPDHLGEDFITILKRITADRLAAKKAKETVKADALKITVNSIFGKLNSDTFWLEDAKAMLSVTVSGQLYLLMLIEALAQAGIHTISANTDGIVCQVPSSKERRYAQICEWWKTKTRLDLEFTDYDMYVRSDVNNYITKKKDGKTKEKGRFSKEVDLKKGYRYPVVARALYEYFINNVSVNETLQQCRDILDFCISQKAGRQFQMELHSLRGDEVTILQKNNRFYVAKTGGSLIKKNVTTGSPTRLYSGQRIRVLNVYDVHVSFESYNVDLAFYKKEAEKIIHDIEPLFEQFGMFDSLAQASEFDADEGDISMTDSDDDCVTNHSINTEPRYDNIPVLEVVCTACPECGSQNIWVMETWGVCGICDRSWPLVIEG